MLEGELGGNLRYDKGWKAENPNGGNGFGQKKVRASFSESPIPGAKDRNYFFNPM